jgi:hypothetical protein
MNKYQIIMFDTFVNLYQYKMSSSEMWRCVDPGLTDVSEEFIASIFRVEKSYIVSIRWE